MQKGQIYRKGDAWLVRYWQDEFVGDKVVRRRRAKKIATFCDQFRTKKSVESLAVEALYPVNANRTQPDSTQTLQQFIEAFYLPDVRKSKQPSTVKGYTDIYEDHIKRRIGGFRLRTFRTVDGQRILDSIASDNPEMAHVSLLHIKSFLSGAFSFARRIGAFDGMNPIQGRGAIEVKGKRSEPTYAYTLPEIEKIIDAVENQTHRAIVTTAAFTGLSLSELRGLKWEDADFKANTITVNRKVWRTHEGDTKTQARQAPVPMISPVAIALSEHRKQSPGSVYVFEGPYQRPLDIATLGTKRIRPALKDSGVEWYGWHAFRRGLATNLHELGVQDKTTQGILRHSSVAVTQKIYIKSRLSAGMDAMKRLEDKLSKPLAGGSQIKPKSFGHHLDTTRKQRRGKKS